MKNFIERTKILTFLTLIATIFTFTACDTNNETGMGTLKVALTDAPANYEQVNIEITHVLVNKNGEADDTTGDGWETVMNDSMTVNLLHYQNGETLDLGETELETGTYNQIRLMLGDNNTVVIDGESHSLTTPSAQQSGYKLNVQAEVEADQVYELVIDFDASQSIIETGNNRYILKPVLRTVDLRNQGGISGTVLPLEAEPYVYAIMDQDTMGTQPNDEGHFELVGLKDGSYNVWFQPTNDAYADSLIEGIEIEDGEKFEFEEDIELESSGVINL